MSSRPNNPQAKMDLELGYIASAVSHGVINVLSSIVSNAELLKLVAAPQSGALEAGAASFDEQFSSPERMLESIIQSALQAAVLSRKLIDRSKPKLERPLGLIQLDQLISTVLANEDPKAERWTFDIAAQHAVKGDGAQLALLTKMLVQYVGSAFDDQNGRGSIMVSADKPPMVRMRVSNAPIDAQLENAPRAFEPFFEIRPGRSGTDLVVAQAIVRAHGGVIQAMLGEHSAVCIEVLLPS